MRKAGADSCSQNAFSRAFRIALAGSTKVAMNQVRITDCSVARQLHEDPLSGIAALNHEHTVDIDVGFSVAARVETSGAIQEAVSAIKPSVFHESLCAAGGEEGMVEADCLLMSVGSINMILAPRDPTPAPTSNKESGLSDAMIGLVAFFAVAGLVMVVLCFLVAVGYREARRDRKNQVKPAAATKVAKRS
jgi:hypothetical protein